MSVMIMISRDGKESQDVEHYLYHNKLKLLLNNILHNFQLFSIVNF